MAPRARASSRISGTRSLQAPVITTFQMTPATDTGIAGDQNTNITQPQFIGQVYNSFPGTVANLSVYVEFNGLHPALNGGFDLAVGGGGRGFTGTYDVLATTNAAGTFSVTPSVPLPQGYQRPSSWLSAQADSPPCRGSPLRSSPPSGSTSRRQAITGSLPGQRHAAPPSPANLSSLQSLTFNVQDPVNQPYAYLATPSQVLFPAIDPATAANISNYSLVLNSDGTRPTSRSTSPRRPLLPIPPPPHHLIRRSRDQHRRLQRHDRSHLRPGLPAGNYKLIAHTKELTYPGLQDAAGNPLSADFTYSFSLQSQPVFITNIAMESTYSNNGSTAIGGPRSYYELPTTLPGYTPRAAAPPTAWVVDLSNPIPYAIPTAAATRTTSS